MDMNIEAIVKQVLEEMKQGGAATASKPAAAPAPAAKPAPSAAVGDGFMNIPDGIDEELPFD